MTAERPKRIHKLLKRAAAAGGIVALTAIAAGDLAVPEPEESGISGKVDTVYPDRWYGKAGVLFRGGIGVSLQLNTDAHVDSIEFRGGFYWPNDCVNGDDELIQRNKLRGGSIIFSPKGVKSKFFTDQFPSAYIISQTPSTRQVFLCGIVGEE